MSTHTITTVPAPDWDNIVQNIAESNCVFFLGPQLLKDTQGEPLLATSLNEVHIQNKQYIDGFNVSDMLFLFNQKGAKLRVDNKIRNAYRSYGESLLKYADGFMSKLADIPFHLIVQTTPDNAIADFFMKKDIPVHQAHYVWSEASTELPEPDRDNPMVYKLLGSLDDTRSLVWEYKDLFDYLQGILGRNELPLALRDIFKQSKEFVFLGFDFDRWYVQLIIRLLNAEQEHIHYIPAGVQPEPFIGDLPYEYIDSNSFAFVDELYAKCAEKGILRSQRGASNEPPIDPKIRAVRKKELGELMMKLVQLKGEYEVQRMLSKDPAEKMSIDMKLESIAKQLEEATTEYERL